MEKKRFDVSKKKNLSGKKDILKKKKATKYSLSFHFGKADWDKVEKIFAADRAFIMKRWNQEKKRNPRTREILTLLAGGAIFALSMVVPTLPMAIAPFIVEGEKYNKRRLKYAMKRLEKQKLVKIIDKNGQILVRITKKGRVRALRYKLEEMTVKKPKIWDRKWRIVIFDIPEKYKRMRDIFRHQLKSMGFYGLQESVWVHPYPCFDEIEFLRQIYGVGGNVTYIIAEKIEGIEDFRKYFRSI